MTDIYIDVVDYEMSYQEYTIAREAGTLDSVYTHTIRNGGSKGTFEANPEGYDIDLNEIPGGNYNIGFAVD